MSSSGVTANAARRLLPRHAPLYLLAALALLLGGYLLDGGGGTTRTRTVTIDSAPGPARVVDGVPVGYTHDRAGAVAAAGEYSRALVDAALDPPRRAALERLATTPRSTGAVGAVFEPLRGARVPYRLATLTAPVAYVVAAADENRATVDVWQLELWAAPGGLSETKFVSLAITLAWVSGDWKIVGLRSGQGPTPSVPDGRPWSARRLAAALKNVSEWRYAP